MKTRDVLIGGTYLFCPDPDEAPDLGMSDLIGETVEILSLRNPACRNTGFNARIKGGAMWVFADELQPLQGEC